MSEACAARRVEWLRRQDSNLTKGAENKGISGDGTENGTCAVEVAADLWEVVEAWPKLGAALKAAVLAVVRSAGAGAQ